MEPQRIELSIPPSLELGDGGEAFARRLAAALMDGLERSVGAIDKEGERVVWQAEGWQDDGTFIVLGVDAAERRVQLLLTPRGLVRPTREPSRVWFMMAVVLALSAIIGKWTHSFGNGLTAAVLGFGIWIALDIARQTAAERRRLIDPAAWRARLERALEAAARE